MCELEFPFGIFSEIDNSGSNQDLNPSLGLPAAGE